MAYYERFWWHDFCFPKRDICYIIELEQDGERTYVYTKNASVHFTDMCRKFATMFAATRFFSETTFCGQGLTPHYKLYSRYGEKILKNVETRSGKN